MRVGIFGLVYKPRYNNDDYLVNWQSSVEPRSWSMENRNYARSVMGQ
jgi:hypothetical protein